jgi:inosose dehydratase
VIRVANAPVSYGAFELTVGVSPNVPGPEDVLAAIAAAGYEGTELGPPGYLGDAETLRSSLDRHGLDLAGAFIPIHFSEPDRWGDDLAAMAATLDLLEAAGGLGRPVLADAGSPGRGASRLDPEGWRQLVEGVRRAVSLARGRGLDPVFHHHAGSFVESTGEIERLLELTDAALLLDTGHLTLADGDPVQALRNWRDRIGHVHVKDVRLGALRGAADMLEIWRRGVFCELGSGDVDLDAFLAELVGGGYDGWLVVEQDRIPAPDEDPAEAAEAQARNRHWLVEHARL